MSLHASSSVEDLLRIIEIQQDLVTTRLPLEALMSRLCEQTLDLIGGTGSAVELLEGDVMVYRAVAGEVAASAVGTRLRADASLSGLCVRRNEVLRCDDVETDARVDREASRSLNIRSMTCVPLVHHETPVGVLKIFSSRPHAFDDRDITLLRLLAGHLSAVLAQATEASEKQAALIKASASESSFRHLVNTAFEGVLISKNGRIVEVNPRFCEMFGLTAVEALERRVVDVVAPRDRDVVARRIRENIQGFYEFSGRRGDGTEFAVEGRGTTIFHEGETIRVSTMRDVSERKRAEEALKRSEQHSLETARMKTEFMANISHEIRTPLNGVMGLSDLLQSTDLSDDQREYARLIRTSANTLLKLVNDVLDFSKLEANKFTLESLPVSVPELVSEVVGPLAAEARAKGVRLESNADGAWPVLLGDPTRIRQVLSNLVTNALKFTARGTVSVTARFRAVEGGGFRVVFAVEDTGLGIAPSALERIFKPFSQGDASMSRRFGGTGLGLSISRQLVEAMDGRIDVESREGSGSKFSFELTLPESAKSKPTRATPGPAAETPGDGARILIAEDNAINRMIALKMVEKMGHRPHAVVNGALALAALEREAFDLVLMDCQMPEMDGFEATRRLKAAGASPPIIAMTANAMPEDRDRCLAAGMDDYIAKPVNYDALEATVARWIRGSAKT